MYKYLLVSAAVLGIAACGGSTSADADGDGEITGAEVAGMADEMINGENGGAVASAAPAPPAIDSAQLEAAEALADRLEQIANSLEN